MGGGDAPASGFALYLEKLMALVKPEVISTQAPERIMVRAESGDAGAVKEAFNIAVSLREAGYVVELDLDGKESGLRWMVDVRSHTPQFTLVDAVKNRKTEISTASDVLKLLEGEGGDKDSPA